MARRCCFLLMALSLAAMFARAVPKDAVYNRLARLSYIEGNVSYQHTADIDWSAASVNLPLEPGDRIYTGDDGRAEIEFDDGSIYRLAHGTDIEILSLQEDRIQLRILIGLSTLMVAGETDFEINTPAAAFTALQKGMYRFSVDENGDSDAVVRKGEAEAANNRFSRRIQAGEMVHVTVNDASQPEYSRYYREDAWDEWNDRRNADMNAYSGRNYLPDNVYIGVYDLNRNGRWINVENYGLAWIPYGIGVSWAPYSTGRWCYRPFYGWTWVSYEPWGWLPYHYGRWYRSSIHGWCWLPGPSFAFNFWSPALVTFYSGPGWVSWCPLGPGDYYNVNHYYYNHRAYGHQMAQLRRLHTRIPGNTYYRGNREAFRTVGIEDFRNGSFGDRGRETRWRDVDQPWRRGEVVRDRLPIQPTATSFRPAPDRRADGPRGIAQATTTIVRNNPEGNLRGQEQFRRITNPEIPALPSRAERRTAQQQRGPQQGGRSNARFQETPQVERANPAISNQQRNTLSTQSGQRATTYRWMGTTEISGESVRSGENSRSIARPENNANSERRNSAGEISQRPAPEQRKAQQPPARVSPRIEEYRRPNPNSEQRSGTTERYGNRPSGFAETPRTDGSRTDSMPRAGETPTYRAPEAERSSANGEISQRPAPEQRKSQQPPTGVSPRIEEYRRPNPNSEQRSGTTERYGNRPSSFAETPRTDGSRTYSTPLSEEAPAYRPPSAARTPSSSAPRQSAPFMERDKRVRTDSEPSQRKSSGNPGPSSVGRTNGNGSPGSSGGGEARGNDRR